MKTIKIIAACFIGFSIQAQTLKDEFSKVKQEVQSEEKSLLGNNAVPSTDEIIQGLKEALSNGTNNSTSIASKVDGYLKNPRLFIPFPPEAQKMRDELVKFGMQKEVSDFETSLNRAAEQAATTAAGVFLAAVKNMNVSDAMSILKGADTAATHYLRQTTSADLYTKYKPIVKDAIAKVKVTQYWDPLVKRYNEIPFVKKQNPDLEDYVTKKAMSGLFLLISDEEAKIRQNPALRVSDILKKVFNYADSQKGK